jgi:tRNA A37 threonylcarbamoyladenosine biosynthesis protein TsaE
VAIEWAERAEPVLPADTIHLYFETLPGAHARRITIRSTMALKA